MKKFISYLLQGLLLSAPLFITFYIVYSLFMFIDNGVNDLIEGAFGIRILGLGIVFGILVIAAVGFISSSLLFEPLFSRFEELITRLPLVKIIYTSIKDLFSAFVSDKKKFDKPVLVKISSFHRLGFLTETDLNSFGLQDKVAVYLPHSYNFSGNLVIVDATDITPLEASTSEVMKFIVSGGVTSYEAPVSTEA